MKKTLIFIILLAFILTGCDTFNSYKDQAIAKFNKSTYNQPEQINQTIFFNQTTILPLPKLIEGYTNIFFFASKEDCVFIVDEFNTSYIVDCAGPDYISNIRKIKNIGYDKVDYLIITTPSQNTLANMETIALKFKPKQIIDTGIPNDYSIYQEYNISETKHIFEKQFVSMLQITPTYEGGFLIPKEMNSLIINMENKVLINPSCIGSCEDKITDSNIDVFYLSNNGECETNSIKKIIQINPEYVLANINLCLNQSNALDMLDIKKLNKENTDYWFVIMNGTLVLR